MTFQSYGQNETLISSIRNIIKDYPVESVFKEFLQNADDAGATRFHIIVDGRSHPTKSLLSNKMNIWQGPAILMFNNAKFERTDFDSLMQIRVGRKQDDYSKIGKYGLGFNSCYHYTDVPSFISGDNIAFLDPQEIFLSKRGVIGSIPKNGINGFDKKDQLAPFEGIEGIDFQSTFEGTLFRIPLRQEPSEISESVFTTEEVLKTINSIKTNFSSQLLFLRNIEMIEISHIPITERTVPPRIVSLWKADVTGSDEDSRKKRKCTTNGVTQSFQIKIEETDNSSNDLNSNSSDKQYDHWVIVTGSQQNPEDDKLKKYARQHRLCVLGGIAALIKSSKIRRRTLTIPPYFINENFTFTGRMYSFLSLSDTTNLPVHLNGTWAQGSDRGRLLIETVEDMPDVDHLKLNWNRHILLDFLPKLYCKLLKEIAELRKDGKIELYDHPISKFWPFPRTTRNCPNYVIEHGCEVLRHIIQNDYNIIDIINDSSNETSNAEILFKLITRKQASELRELLRNSWDDIEKKVVANQDFKQLIGSFPIWPTLSDPLQPDSEPPLKPASCGYILPKNTKHYRTKKTKIYLDPKDDIDRTILASLGVITREICTYVLEDVEFPKEWEYYYLNFLKSILNNSKIVKGLKNKSCFPTFTKKLRKITDLYDHDNIVFRTVFSGNTNMFLSQDLLEHAALLSGVGFKNSINQVTFTKCAMKVEELQRKLKPPLDIRYRGFILVDHFYKYIIDLELENIMRIPFVPISKNLDKPYSLNYHRTRTLDCFNNIILPKYKEVAWSQMSLIAEDVVPPQHVLEKCPSLGKPKVTDVIEHLRFLFKTILKDDEWRNNWVEIFKHNIFEIYKWFEEECSNGDLNLSEYIHTNETLFLNFNKDNDPFDIDNWVSAENLVLNSEPNEVKYVNPRLAKYSAMLKSAGVREVKQPNIEIHIRQHDQSYINKRTMLELLSDQKSPLNNFAFIVDGEKIKANQCMLAASSKYFRRELASARLGPTPTNTDKIIVKNIEPNSMRVLLRYLYGQSIDDAIKSLNINNESGNPTNSSKSNNEMEEEDEEDIDDEMDDYDEEDSDDEIKDVIYKIYKDLLKLANDYELDHLKELMELRLLRFVKWSNVEDMIKFAEDSKANQLEEFCSQFIKDNDGLF